MIKLVLIVFFALAMLFLTSPASAQTPSDPLQQAFYKARVEKIVKEDKVIAGGRVNPSQTIQVKLLDGPDKGKTMTLTHGGMFTITDAQKVTSGETLILRHTTSPEGKTNYYVYDKYRLPVVGIIFVGFLLIVFLVAGKKGLGAIGGMLISLGVIMWFIVPQILSGADPLFISIIGSIFILFVTMYLAHGFSRQTTLALSATAMSLFLTAILAIVFVSLAKLSGLGSEDAYSLQQSFAHRINFQGLLLGGIIIGALGVLDDVTTTQAATVHEISEANPKATVTDLIRQGMKVGSTHIASVVNTLVLAYAGASIGIFIFLHLGIQNQSQPLWTMLNNEVIIEEVVRTIAGSIGLILAVPITTLLSAFFAKNEIKIS